jgi:hypothetical protein
MSLFDTTASYFVLVLITVNLSNLHIYLKIFFRQFADYMKYFT